MSRAKAIQRVAGKQQSSLPPAAATQQAAVEQLFFSLVNEEGLKQYKTDGRVRAVLAVVFSIITVAYIVWMVWVIERVGKGVLEFSDTTLIALLTTAAANVFGLWHVVGKYYFRPRSSGDE